ncbi:MAG: potassium transporter TrkG [Eubacterium sp.]
MTAFLIVVGAILILILEYQNPATLGPLSFFDKIQAAFFQSVTTRTAGFCTISQSGLNKSTALVCCLLMFIGGSPSV